MAHTFYDSELTAEEIEAALEAIDGVIAPANNGKVLAIENGGIVAKDVSEYTDLPVLVSKNITANGNYDPASDDADGYSSVAVNVPNTYAAGDEGKVVSNGALVAQTARSSQITENGTYDTTLNNSVQVNVSGGGSAVIEPLSVTQNGTYTAPSGVDGYSPITVNVAGGGSVSETDQVPSISDMANGEVKILYGAEMDLDAKPTVQTPTAGIAGQNSGNALACLNYSGTLNDNYKWTTNDRNYNNLWIGADYGSPIVLNSFVVAPRTWANNRQIYTAIMEASNDLNTWAKICESSAKGNEMPVNKWHCVYGSNNVAYRYYRLRTETDASGTVNGSVTYTLQGIGFFLNGDGQSLPKIYKSAFYKVNDTLYEFTR